ncbi:hypothetical protein ILYODFUR_018082, partial [Ilyodon furcidens]
KDCENKKLCTSFTHHKIVDPSVTFLTSCDMKSMDMIILFPYMFCGFAAGGAFRWSFFKYSIVKHSVDREPHQSWLAWGGLHSFIKMTGLTFQIFSFLFDICLFILLCKTSTEKHLRNTYFKVNTSFS